MGKFHECNFAVMKYSRYLPKYSTNTLPKYSTNPLSACDIFLRIFPYAVYWYSRNFAYTHFSL
jgi:hypothetical protein